MTSTATPGFWHIARRLKWIAALALALGVAAAFAALGQWQLERSLETAIVDERDTETPVPLDSIAEPQRVMTSEASGRVVTVSGSWVEGDEVIVTGRLSGAGEAGHCRHRAWIAGPERISCASARPRASSHCGR